MSLTNDEYLLDHVFYTRDTEEDALVSRNRIALPTLSTTSTQGELCSCTISRFGFSTN